jgi:hypothetical protein
MLDSFDQNLGVSGGFLGSIGQRSSLFLQFLDFIS